jgi:hypothetical protein
MLLICMSEMTFVTDRTWGGVAYIIVTEQYKMLCRRSNMPGVAAVLNASEYRSSTGTVAPACHPQSTDGLDGGVCVGGCVAVGVCVRTS